MRALGWLFRIGAARLRGSLVIRLVAMVVAVGLAEAACSDSANETAVTVTACASSRI